VGIRSQVQRLSRPHRGDRRTRRRRRRQTPLEGTVNGEAPIEAAGDEQAEALPAVNGSEPIAQPGPGALVEPVSPPSPSE
jgi:hypothetical protein